MVAVAVGDEHGFQLQIAEAILPTNLATGRTATQLEMMELELGQIHVKGLREEQVTTWMVNERPCQSLAAVYDVLTTLAQMDHTVPVILDIDVALTLGDMIDAYDICRLVGFNQIQFAASAEN